MKLADDFTLLPLAYILVSSYTNAGTATGEGLGLVGLIIYFLGLQMAHKCKITGKTLALTVVCIGQNF